MAQPPRKKLACTPMRLLKLAAKGEHKMNSAGV